MKRILGISTLFLLLPWAAWALTCSLTWVAPTTNTDGSPLTDLAGYNTYTATQSGQYGAKHNSQLITQTTYSTTCTLGQFWMVRAVDQAGNESANSNEVRITDAVKPAAPTGFTGQIVP